MGDRSTDINEILNKNKMPQQGGMPQQQGGMPQGIMKGQIPPNPVNTSPDGVQAAARFAQMPSGGPQGMAQGNAPRVGGPGQGMSKAEPPTSGKKEFFGLKETDYKSTIVVFALILILSSTFFFDMLKTYLPAVMQDGKTTLIGSLITALLGSVVYIVVKCVANLN